MDKDRNTSGTGRHGEPIEEQPSMSAYNSWKKNIELRTKFTKEEKEVIDRFFKLNKSK